MALSREYHYVPESHVIVYIDFRAMLRVHDVDNAPALHSEMSNLALNGILWFDIQPTHLTILDVDCNLYHWTTV